MLSADAFTTTQVGRDNTRVVVRRSLRSRVFYGLARSLRLLTVSGDLQKTSGPSSRPAKIVTFSGNDDQDPGFRHVGTRFRATEQRMRGLGKPG